MNKKTIFITGGARRLGEIIAVHFAKLGYDIALHYNSSKQQAQDLQSKISALGVKIKLYQGDLCNYEYVQNLLTIVKKDFAHIDILINNASVFYKESFLDSNYDNYQQFFAVHVTAPYFLTQNFAKIYQKGHVINITDSRISKNKTNYFAYLLSKKSLSDLTAMLATELAPQIKVNEICPGKFLPSLNPKEDISEADLSKKIPAQKMSNPQQIIDTIEYIVKTNPIGQKFFVDGGENLI